MRAAARHREELTWDDFALTWLRIVRRVIFGDRARNDHGLTELLNQLRADANWAFLKPQRRQLRAKFYARMQPYLEQADFASLAGVMAATPNSSRTAPEQQVPQWLFAFDAAGIATFRTLALLVTHPVQAAHARQELQERAGPTQLDRPFLRAYLLDALRLWPTTPMVLRQTSTATNWEAGTMPANTGILIYAPFFHRDAAHLPDADRFNPDLWLSQRTTNNWPLIPFSSGPGMCPGRNLVLLLSSALLTNLLEGQELRLKPPTRLDPARPLPATLNNYALSFAVS